MDSASRILFWTLLALGVLVIAVRTAGGQAPADKPAATRCAAVELFVRPDSERSRLARTTLETFASGNPGVCLIIRDVVADKNDLARYHQLAKHFKIEKPTVPAVLAGNRFHLSSDGETVEIPHLRSQLTIEVFTREGCPRCAAVKAYLARTAPRYSGFTLVTRDVIKDGAARGRFEQLCREHHVQAASLPGIHVGGQMLIGYQGDAITGGRITALLNAASIPCPSAKPSATGGATGGGPPPAATHAVGDDLPPPPPEDVTTGGLPPAEDTSDAIEVPVFGTLRVGELGLPAFTFLIGLVDGFNPCAMWVLLFLLSVLVNLQDRAKILAVAGTFVLISGLAYFAFMAAWLNVFLLIGLARPAQIALGILALAIGAVHVKDFFAFHKGFSLSIPESAKPGIYDRVRRIVAARSLGIAVSGAIVLALLVNVVELLCTAGLPALYTQVLTMQELPAWQNYGYLGLYNVAYMLDDTLMLTIVVTTLSRRRLQESGGRWLKLISGLAVLALGLVMLFKPEWLA